MCTLNTSVALWRRSQHTTPASCSVQSTLRSASRRVHLFELRTEAGTLDADSIAPAHLTVIMRFIETQFASMIENLHLWTLFRPGTLVRTKIRGFDSASKVSLYWTIDCGAEAGHPPGCTSPLRKLRACRTDHPHITVSSTLALPQSRICDVDECPRRLRAS